MIMPLYTDLLKHKDSYAAIADNGDSLTYTELSDFSKKVGVTIPKRSLLFILCENTRGSLAGCVAFLNNQIVPLLLDAGLDRQLLARLLDIYRPAHLYIPSRLRHEFPGFDICMEEFDYSLLQTGFTEQASLHDDLALLLTTSGSTGSPKLVRLSYENIRSNSESIVSYLGIKSGDRPITTLPMHYSYGFSIINSHLMVGGTILLTTKTLVEKGFWDFFRELQATSFGGVPYTFEMLNKLRFFRMELSSLKTITQAGGKLSIELSRNFAEYATNKGMRFFVMYGQTEATARMSYLPSEYALSKCGSIGIAIPGGEFFLIDKNSDIIIGSNHEGELAYRGPNVSLGYAESRDDLTKGDERNGMLLTGDMARRDEDGFYFITGRKKRFLKIFGNRINLDETECMIKSSYQNIECACAGVDDKMYIFVTEGPCAEDIRKFVSERTGLNQVAFKVVIVDAIPKNESGKTSYIALERMIAGEI